VVLERNGRVSRVPNPGLTQRSIAEFWTRVLREAYGNRGIPPMILIVEPNGTGRFYG